MPRPDSEQTTRPSLLIRLRDTGDAEAWTTFEEVYAPLIQRQCRWQGLQDADIEDMTQEVLAEVMRACRSFQYSPDRGRFRDWLRTVTYRRLAAFYQHRQGKDAAIGGGLGDRLLEQVADPAADDDWNAAFNARVLHVALRRIQPHFETRTWQAFVLTWLKHRPPAPVAKELGLPIEQVYVARSRVLKRLREEVLALAEELSPFEPSGPDTALPEVPGLK